MEFLVYVSVTIYIEKSKYRCHHILEMGQWIGYCVCLVSRVVLSMRIGPQISQCINVRTNQAHVITYNPGSLASRRPPRISQLLSVL